MLIADVTDLRHASALLAWDERVNMPPGGVPAHAEMLATVRRIAHEKFTSVEVGELLEQAADEIKTLPQDHDACRIVEVATRDYRKATLVPPDYVAEHARVAASAHQAWREARETSDFQVFRPHLEKIINPEAPVRVVLRTPGASVRCGCSTTTSPA
jgi:carboxypeptidase Taq